MNIKIEAFVCEVLDFAEARICARYDGQRAVSPNSWPLAWI